MATEAADNRGVPPVRPALEVLQADQRALLTPTDDDRYADEHHLRGGFPDRRALIRWYQRAAVRTLGHIADRVGPDALEHDAVFLSATITGAERGRWLDEPLSPEAAERYRDWYEAEIVQQACVRAYKDLREVAVEHIGEDAAPSFGDIEPAKQRHVAMRPGFQQLDEWQAETLASLWDGLDDKTALLDWLHDLNRPTNGEIRDDVAVLTEQDDIALGHLVTPDGGDVDDRRYREWFAIKLLLPAFVDGVREMTTTELVAGISEPLEPIQG